MMNHSLALVCLAALFIVSCQSSPNSDSSSAVEPAQAVQPYENNPRYWQYEGEPILLRSGTRDDNLFQIPTLEGHLDTLAAVGGNYIRNTMSDRPTGGFEVYAFKRLDNGKYDLEQWNPEYWDRLERMLKLTQKRDIIVQLSLWDQWDVNIEGRWEKHPWNPENNVNYSLNEVTLRGDSAYLDVRHNSGVKHDFYLTVPSLQDDETVLKYQKRFVNKVLDYTLQYDNVLYTITNEIFIQHPTDWSRYWAEQIRSRAKEAGRQVFITEMFQLSNVKHEQHRASLDHPEVFDYIDISQNSRQQGQTHWNRLQWVRNYISDHPRPVNHVKIYGGETKWTYGPEQAIDCFWRNLIGGAASARFHRPPAGIGLNHRVREHLRSVRMLQEGIRFIDATPDVQSKLLADREPDEAYLMHEGQEAYAVYFPDGGEVQLDLSAASDPYDLRWLNTEESEWQESSMVSGGQAVTLSAPGSGDWVALLEKQ